MLKCKSKRSTDYIDGQHRQCLKLTVSEGGEAVADAIYVVVEGAPTRLFFTLHKPAYEERMSEIEDEINNGLYGHAGKMVGIRGARSGKEVDSRAWNISQTITRYRPDRDHEAGRE